MGFLDTFNRIRLETDLQTQDQLARFLGIRQSSVSGAKKRGQFPRAWAEKVSRHYHLRYEWIMDGREPKRIDQRPESLREYFPRGLSLSEEALKSPDIDWEEINDLSGKLWHILIQAPEADRRKVKAVIDQAFHNTRPGT